MSYGGRKLHRKIYQDDLSHLSTWTEKYYGETTPMKVIKNESWVDRSVWPPQPTESNAPPPPVESREAQPPPHDQYPRRNFPLQTPTQAPSPGPYASHPVGLRSKRIIEILTGRPTISCLIVYPPPLYKWTSIRVLGGPKRKDEIFTANIISV